MEVQEGYFGQQMLATSQLISKFSKLIFQGDNLQVVLEPTFYLIFADNTSV